MKPSKTRVACFAITVLFVTALAARADIARPKPSPAVAKVVLHTSLVVVPDSKVYEARLQISESNLRELRAAMDNVPTGSGSQAIGATSTRTIMAGIFMFLSLSFAGVWMARLRETRSRKTVALLIFGVAVMSAAAMLTRANAGPPSSFYWRKLPQNLSKGNPTNGGVDIEIVPDPSDGTGLKLIVPIRPE